MSRVIISPAGGDLALTATIASGSSIVVPSASVSVVFLTGTTSVNTMTGGASGDIVTLVASGQSAGICVVLNHATSTNNLDLRDNLNLGIYAGESVTFIFDGTKWIETARNLKTVLDYVEITSEVSVTATTEGAANTAITGTAITFDGATPILVEVFAPYVETAASSGAQVVVVLYDGTSIGRLGTVITVAAVSLVVPFRAARSLTPIAGAHTYSTRVYRSVGNGTIGAGVSGSGAYMPAYQQILRDI